jgi:hydroxypyruvate reductase
MMVSLRRLPHSLCAQGDARAQAVLRVLDAALQAVEPAQAVRRHLHREGDTLSAGGQAYNLRRLRHLWLVGAGKAAVPMAGAVADLLGDDLSGGLVITKYGHGGTQAERLRARGVDVHEAGHPLPDAQSVAATQALLERLATCNGEDLVILVLSGGGSALLTAPAPGITLDDLQRLTAALLACGATINEINTLRKHLDRVKGGGLARLTAPAHLLALILSDVVGDPLDVIASGPTVPDPTTYAEALAILERYGLTAQAPAAILDHLRRGLAGEHPETLKPGDPRFEQVQNLIVGNNLQAAQAARAQAQAEGFQTLLLTTYLQGEASQAGRFLAALARQIAASGDPLPRPACLITGGETTVTLRGNGRGGRNQEMALGAVADVAGLADVLLLTLATDGGDGPTDAAGAVVSGATLARAQALGLDPYAHLARNDSYSFFAALDDLLITGPTQTNVNDLAFLFAF